LEIQAVHAVPVLASYCRQPSQGPGGLTAQRKWGEYALKRQLRSPIKAGLFSVSRGIDKKSLAITVLYS